MSDTPLLERARDYAAGSYSGHGIVTELADELERLTRELAEARKRIFVYTMAYNTGGIDELHARAERAESDLAESRASADRLRIRVERAEAALADEKTLSAAISRDCNDTALERNALAGQLAAVLSELEQMRAALAELVRLKDLRYSVQTSRLYDSPDRALQQVTQLEATAWERARALSEPQAKDDQPRYSYQRAVEIAKANGLPTEFPEPQAKEGKNDA